MRIIRVSRMLMAGRIISILMMVLIPKAKSLNSRVQALKYPLTRRITQLVHQSILQSALVEVVERFLSPKTLKKTSMSSF